MSRLGIAVIVAGLMVIIFAALFGFPSAPPLSQEQLTVLNPKTMCGYIAHPDDQQDTWLNTTLDHCRVLQQEAVETWWDATIVDMQERGDL